MALETAFVGAYMGAVTALKTNDLKGVAAQIGANESRHLSVLTNIGAGAIVPAPDLPKVLTAAQATAAVTPFLAVARGGASGAHWGVGARMQPHDRDVCPRSDGLWTNRHGIVRLT